MYPSTYELFEFNKMWFVFGTSLIILFLWTSKVILIGKLTLKRTPFDILILIFLSSQLLSTIFSLDSHTSFWGYYSRFNGGLLSLITYLFLFYAFLNNLTKNTKENIRGIREKISDLNENLTSQTASYKILFVSFLSGSVVALWGLPSHFGYDPTCFLFRGSLDVACWTDAFRPKVRMFSTLGQPNWLAAYLSVLIPLSLAFGISKLKINSENKIHSNKMQNNHQNNQKQNYSSTHSSKNFLLKFFSATNLPALAFFFMSFIFYLDLIYANSQSGFIGFWIANIVFIAILILMLTKNHTLPVLKQKLILGLIALSIISFIPVFITSLLGFFSDDPSSLSSIRNISILVSILLITTTVLTVITKNRSILKSLWNQKIFKIVILINFIFLFATFFNPTPISGLNKFTFPEIKNKILSKLTSPSPAEVSTKAGPTIPTKTENTPPPTFGESGITTSSKIRLIVWQGALEIFKQNPIFGTGTETFAFAYYKVKPKKHNLTSEWDYLYNKAHNEYLNYLSTTGMLGFGSYMALIIYFLYYAIKTLLNYKHPFEIGNYLLALALLSAYISILISNFFGFSVVIINIFFFLIPLFFYLLINKNGQNSSVVEFQTEEKLSPKLAMKRFIQEKKRLAEQEKVGSGKIIIISIAFLLTIYLEYHLTLYWLADKNYAVGTNLDKIGEYAQAYKPLSDAVKLRPGEYTYKDEMSSNLAALAVYLHQQNESTNAAILADRAKKLSDEVIEKNPNNVVFAKTRTRVYYSLSEIDKDNFPKAIEALEKAKDLAPTDVKIIYNLALFYDQLGNKEKAIDLLKETTNLKPNYKDAYYALGILYTQMHRQEENSSKAGEFKNKAKENLNFILQNIEPNDKQVEELLKSL